MSKPEETSGDDVVSIRTAFGFAIHSQRGSHVNLRQVTAAGQRQTLTVPRHKELDGQCEDWPPVGTRGMLSFNTLRIKRLLLRLPNLTGTRQGLRRQDDQLPRSARHRKLKRWIV